MPPSEPPDLEPQERPVWSAAGEARAVAAAAACPDPLRLRAYLSDALSAEEAPAVESHLLHCRLCQRLRDDLAALELEPLAADETERIRTRVFAAAGPGAPRAPARPGGAGVRSTPSWRPLWRPALLVVVGVIFAMAASFVVWRLEATHLSRAQTTAALPTMPASQAEFHLDKPPVDLSAVVVWRGATRSQQQALAAALADYRDGRYAAAAAGFQAVIGRSPGAFEPLFYWGICQLYLGQNAAAASTLGRAAALVHGTARQDADWYRALALVRAGHAREALPLLRGLCDAGSGFYATRACQGAQMLAAVR